MQAADEITKLKEKYNHFLERNRKAEEYFKDHTVEECLRYLKLFNEVTQQLSKLMIEIKAVLGREMTQDEILNGF